MQNCLGGIMKSKLYRKHISDVFSQLLNEYPFEKITVQMIVKKSDISKATFYRYFLDKYDVMNFKFQEFINEVYKFEKCRSFRDFCLEILISSQHEKKRIHHAYETKGLHSYPKFLYEKSYQLIEQKVKLKRKGKGLSDKEACECSLFCHGCTNAVYDWVNGKYPLSAEEVADIFYNSMPESMRDLW